MPFLKCAFPDCRYVTDNLSEAFAAALLEQLKMHERAVHTAAPVPQPHKLKIDPPKLDVGATPEEWQSFKRQWAMYKSGTLLSDEQVATALFYCCTEGLRLDIMRDMQDDVAAMTETVLLTHLKRLAVKEESILVQRIKMGRMQQSPGMGVRTFLANLRGQAALCLYEGKCKKCQQTYDFSNEIIKDTLIRGISDPEILADLLGDAKPDRTLDEVVQFISQKEQGKSTRAAVGDSAAPISAKTQKQPHQGKCWACGNRSHGPKNDKATREKHCPAWSMTCGKCGIKGHMTKVCQKCTSCGKYGHRDNSSKFCSNSKSKTLVTRDLGSTDTNLVTTDLVSSNENQYTDQLCAVNTTTGPYSKKIEHHIFDGKWMRHPSMPHPMVWVKATPLPEEHTKIGAPTPISKLKAIDIAMVADSGCQSCIVPYATAEAMGYTAKDLMPVSMYMRGAIKENLGVEGGIILEIKVEENRRCKQMVYVSKIINQAFLCREALIQLNILPKGFPEVMMSQLTRLDLETSGCECPKRVKPPPKPTSLPLGMKGTEEEVPQLKEWLLQYYKSSTFNTCEHQPLPMMTGEPLRLYTDPKAKPVAVHKPATVAVHWQEKVLSDLNRDVALGVLEKVGPNTPVTWCSRMVITAKSNGTPRRTVDLQPQNKHSARQTHHSAAPFRLAEQIPSNVKKSITDAWNGYHSIPLHEEDKHITTFITPWGRFRYKVAPQGFIASGDAYTQRFDSLIVDFRDKVKCIDDTCMWAPTIKDAFFQACDWLDLCGNNGITLNPDKFQFAQDSVEFAGLTITNENIKPSQKFLASVQNFPAPKDITGARAWFGLVNQGAYAFSMSTHMRPFRDLLKPDNKFSWTEDLEKAFTKSKAVMVEEMEKGVRLFEPYRPTCLSTDWSNEGIGFTLKQKHCHCQEISPTCCKEGWQLCLVGSRFTTPAESRYAPIEGEALAVVYALQQTRYYVLGCPNLIVTTDHKPLINVLNERSLNDITNRRLLNLKEKTMQYQFEIKHVSGSKNRGPDALSRYPAQTTGIEHQDIADDISTKTTAMETLYVTTNMITWEMVKEATSQDETLQHLAKCIQMGSAEFPMPIRAYQKWRNHLYIVDGIIMMGERIIVPTKLRPQILATLHAAHQGVNAMSQRAADTVFWPGISIDITRTREECVDCHRIAKSNPSEPPAEIEHPEYPFQKLCADYFTHMGKNYLVIVDRYTNWPLVFRENGTASSLIKHLRDIFSNVGAAKELTTDGGPQFTAEATQDFLRSWDCHHRRTSVGNPHANTRAEVAVKTVKRLLMTCTGSTGSLDTDSFHKAMLVYRNSIDPETKASPAMILFGRPLRDPIPTPIGKLCLHPTWKETLDNRDKAMAKRHNREREKWDQKTSTLTPLKIGDHVYIQNLSGNNPLRWERTGIIMDVKDHHQYSVKVDGSGRTTLRNRKHLRKFVPFVRATETVIPEHPWNPSNHENKDDHIGSQEKEIEDSTLPQWTQEGPETELEGDNEDNVTEESKQDSSKTFDGITVNETTPKEATTDGNPSDEKNQLLTERIPQQKKLPLALRRLMPHNNPGLQE